MTQIKGNITNKDGFPTSVTLPKRVKVELAGVGYNYFINNKEERKQIIKQLKIGDLVLCDVLESKGFKYIDNIVVLEVKELPPPDNNTTDTTPQQLIQHKQPQKLGLCCKLIFQKLKVDLNNPEQVEVFKEQVNKLYQIMSELE